MKILSFTLFLSAINQYSSSSPHDYNGWLSGASLPRPSYHLAAGYNDNTDTIFLLGGQNNNGSIGQLVEYKRENDIFIDVDKTYFDQFIGGDGQFYAQSYSWIFMIFGDSVTSFDVNNKATDYNHVTIPVDVGRGGCVCTLGIYLVINGGGTHEFNDAINTVQILDIPSNTWLGNVASLNTPRMSHTCNAYDDTVFSIGGYDGSVLDTVEIYNFDDNEWHYISDKLSTPIMTARSIVFQNEIVIFGGWDDSNEYLNIITVINAITHEIYPVSSYVDIRLHQTAAINAAGTIYLFGGFGATESHLLSSMRYVEPGVLGPQYQGKDVDIEVYIDVEPKSAGCYSMIVIMVIIMVSYLIFVVVFIFLSTKPKRNENDAILIVQSMDNNLNSKPHVQISEMVTKSDNELVNILQQHNLYNDLYSTLKEHGISLEMIKNDITEDDKDDFCTDIGLKGLQKVQFKTLCRIVHGTANNQETVEMKVNNNKSIQHIDKDSDKDIDKDIAKKQKIFGVLNVLSAIFPPIFYTKFSNNVLLGILIISFAACQIIFQFVRHYISSKNGKQLKMKTGILFVVVGSSLFNISQGTAIIAGVNYDYSNTMLLIISSWFAFLGEDVFSVILTVFLELNEKLYGIGAKVMYFIGFVQIVSNSYIYGSYLHKTAMNMNLHLFCDLSIELAAIALIIQLLYFIAGIIVFVRVKDPKQNEESAETMDQPQIEIPV